MRVDEQALAELPETSRTNAAHASVGILAVTLADALANEDVMFIASDEQRAEALAAALRVAALEAIVIHCPSSDALPGDSAPASPATVGRRVGQCEIQ